MNDVEVLSQLNKDDKDALESIVPKMREFVVSGDAMVAAEIEKSLEQRPGLIGVLFPGKLQKKHDELFVKKMGKLHNYEDSMMEAYSNVLIALAKNEGDMLIDMQKEKYGNIMTVGRAENLKKLATIFQDCLNDMLKTFNEYTKSFNALRDQQMEDLKKYKNDDFYYKKLKTNFEKQANVFFDSIDTLQSGFIQNVKDRFGIELKK